jgi:serine/threonine-protein kinase
MNDAGSSRQLGRYHIGEPLGGGPTGEVFRAKVVGVAGYERQYALKRFHAALAADPATAEILASAARGYAGVIHPFVARMAEYGVAAGQSFVAVELINGVDAARLLSGSAAVGDPVPRGALLTLVGQVARGVAYAQARGVRHLGICPTNVLISVEGDPKVTDFGLVRARLRGPATEDSTLVARLPYLAPEQLEAHDGSTATDVFQIAALAYELLTGERAFGGRSGPEIAAAIAQTPPEPRDLPAPIWEVLARALAHDPLARHPSAVAFADAFETVVKKLALPGGRADLAAAVKRAQARTADLLADNASGALSFPLPAPPPSTPGVALSSLFPGGQIPRKTLATLVAPPPIPTAKEPPPPPPAAPPPTPISSPTPIPSPMPPPATGPEPVVASARRSRWPLVVLLGAVVLAGGYLVYDQVAGTVPAVPDAPAVRAAAPPPDAGTRALTVTVADSGTVTVTVTVADSGTVAAAVPAPVPDAAPARVAEARPPASHAPGPAGKLIIASTPAGAEVFLDGAAKGRTPVELPASGDRHKLALFLPGHKLALLDIDGSGRTEATLEPVEKLRGPAGIKVKCSTRGRLYISVDGKDTGLMCPTERIGVELGPHTVGSYDPATEQTSSQKVDVRETHFSAKVTVP